VLTRTEADRAALIGRLHRRDEAAWLIDHRPTTGNGSKIGSNGCGSKWKAGIVAGQTVGAEGLEPPTFAL
jgi:hypothetical protein